jgi:hypothetical protein
MPSAQETKTVINSLFRGVSGSVNFVQQEQGNKNPHLLLPNQKSIRAVVETSFENEEGRVFTNTLLDLKDHTKFKEELKKAQKILSPKFQTFLKEYLIENPGDAEKKPLDIAFRNKEMEAFLMTEGINHSQGIAYNFLCKFFGKENLTLKDLATASVRIMVDGDYTSSCGALSIEDDDPAALSTYVRSKLIGGILHFSKDERRALHKVLTEEVLQVTNFSELKKNMRKEGLSDSEISRVLQQKRDAGIKDYTELSPEEAQQLKKQLLLVRDLYSKAANVLGGRKYDVMHHPFGLVVGPIFEQLRAQEVSSEEPEKSAA